MRLTNLAGNEGVLCHEATSDQGDPRFEADLTPIDILHLQPVTGNHAMGHLLPRSAPFTHPASIRLVGARHDNGMSVQSTGMSAASVTIQRWGAGEHEMLGDKGSGFRNVELAPGYTLSFGEVVALAGDHFANIEQMRPIPESDLVSAVDGDRVGGRRPAAARDAP
jgi:hypothetical protein